jgi:hypothetical protein
VYCDARISDGIVTSPVVPLTSRCRIAPVELRTAKLPAAGVRTSTSAASAVGVREGERARERKRDGPLPES